MIFLIYPRDERRIATPWSIGNNLQRTIRNQGLELSAVNVPWDASSSFVEMSENDILIGHPNPNGGPWFEMAKQKCKAKIAILPYNASPRWIDFLDRIYKVADAVGLLCGPYWRNFLSPIYRRRTFFFCNGIHGGHYPFVKSRFNPTGKRRVLYVGCCEPEKGTMFLEELIHDLPEIEFGHYGPGRIQGMKEEKFVDFSSSKVLEEMSEKYDFIINTGVHDASASPQLEGASWGIYTFCTSQSGWDQSCKFTEALPPTADKKYIKGLLKYLVFEALEEDLLLKAAAHRLALRDWTWDVQLQPVIERLKSLS